MSEMRYIPNKMKGKTPYDPISGSYSIRLDANESPYPIPAELLDRFCEALKEESLNRYPDPTCASVRNAFSSYYRVDPANVVVGNGSDELINLILNCFFDKGDKVGIATPEFSMYRFYAELAEDAMVFTEKDSTFSLDRFSAFAKENGCRAVIFSNPCNPTGAGFDKEEVLRFIRQTSCLCIIDEAYMDFWNQSILTLAPEFENVIVLRTLSKAFGAAGARIGFAVANPLLIRNLNVARSPYNVNSLSQRLATLLLENGDLCNHGKELGQRAKELQSRLTELFPDARVFPTCANFVFMETPNASELFRYLADCGIAVRLFGNSHLRICAGTEKEMDRLYETLTRFGTEDPS